MNKLLIEKIKLQVKALYWEGDVIHNKKTSDIYQNCNNTMEQLEDVIKDCIKLLEVSGKNTKEQVKQKLEELIDEIHN